MFVSMSYWLQHIETVMCYLAEGDKEENCGQHSAHNTVFIHVPSGA